MKTLIPSSLLLLILGTSAFANEPRCHWMSEFTFVKTIESWENNNIEPTIYVEESVPSRIGDFKFEIYGGTHQQQYVGEDQLSCSPEEGAVNYIYTNKVVIEVGETSELALEALVTFPNGFQLKVESEKFSTNRMQLLPEGIKEIGPFAPAGTLSTKKAILAVGKLGLSAEDFATLKSAF